MLIENIFVSTVAVDMLDLDNEVIKQFCYDVRERQGESRSYSNYGGWHSNVMTGHVPVLNNLFKEAYMRLLKLHEIFNFRDDLKPKIETAWFTINNKGHFNHPHTHRGYTFSGVYYVTAPENCGDLILVHPSQVFPYHYESWVNHLPVSPFKGQTLEHSMAKVYYKPEPGKLIIFPSWLQHYVLPNQTDDDRISISFDVNLIPK